MKPQFFLSVQGSYKNLEMALYYAEDCVGRVQIESVRASAHGLIVLEDLLRAHNVALKDLAFIAVDSGPGAFTSLRVTITMVNALAFALKVPLLEIDGLDALAYQVMQDHKNISSSLTIIPLLNAYSQEVYAAFYKKESDSLHLLKPTMKGSYKITSLISLVQKNLSDEMIIIAGNAVSIYLDVLQEIKTGNVILDCANRHATCTSDIIARKALERWTSGDPGVYKITPSYLKQSVARTGC